MTRGVRAGTAIMLWACAATLCSVEGLAARSDVASAASLVGSVQIVGVEVGFDGHYKVGAWTPLRLTIRVGGDGPVDGLVEIELLDGDETPCLFQTAFQNPSGEFVVPCTVRFGRRECELVVRFTVEGQTLAERRFRAGDGADLPAALPTHEELWIGIGRGVGLEAAARRIERTQGSRGVRVVWLEDVSDLPPHWFDYDAVSVVALAASQPAGWQAWTAENPQPIALRQWVERGGRLLLCGGAGLAPLFAPSSPLAVFQSGQIDGDAPLRSLGAFEQYADTSVRLPAPATGTELRVPRLTGVRGVVEAREGDLPLIVRTPLGFGHTVCVPLDLDRAPFTEWTAQGEFVAKLLGQSTLRGEATAGGQQVNWLGITDLSGQLRGALDQFPGIRLIPFWLVALLILGYVALIGPLDYLLVHKLLKRPELTWITFPLIVAATCLGGYALARAMKGDTLRVNQVDLVDCDLESGLVRGATWLSAFSPRPQTYDVALTPQTADGQPAAHGHTLLGWFGLPGTAMGGLDGAAAGPALWRRAYRSVPLQDRLEGVPIQVWSSKSFAARWSHTSPPGLTAKLSTDFEQVPRGTITNATPFALSDALLAYGRWAIAFDRPIEPGETVDLGSGVSELDRTELATRITSRRMLYDDAKKQFVASAQAYDLQGFHYGEILKQMMFYQAVDGQQYTQLAHRHQQFVDLSGLLAAGRAILMARGPAGAARLDLNGSPLGPEQLNHETYYRFVIPVAPHQAKPSK